MIQHLYNVHHETLEYLPENDIPESQMDLNPMYRGGVHPESEKYLFNPITSTLTAPPETGPNEVACLVDKKWIIKADYRGNAYWDTATREKHIINDLGLEPNSSWTDAEPQNCWQVWNGSSWQDDFVKWLEQWVRPQRDVRLSVSDKYLLPDYPITPEEKQKWLIYRHALRDLPSVFTEVVDPIPWPVEP